MGFFMNINSWLLKKQIKNEWKKKRNSKQKIGKWSNKKLNSALNRKQIKSNAKLHTSFIKMYLEHLNQWDFICKNVKYNYWICTVKIRLHTIEIIDIKWTFCMKILWFLTRHYRHNQLMSKWQGCEARWKWH